MCMVRGREVDNTIDPNAPTTYKVKHIYCLNRKVKGKAGVKRLRHLEFIPATITGNGLPLQLITLEWGRLKGLLQTQNLYRGRKYVLNIEDQVKIVGKLAFVQFDPVSDKALFVKFVRTSEDPSTITSERLPHLVLQDKRDKIIAEKLEKKRQVQLLNNIDLTFKPAIKKKDYK
eukprot:gene3116-3897_t